MEDEEWEDTSAQNSVKCTLSKGQKSLLLFFLARVQGNKRTSVKDQGWNKLSRLGKKDLDIKRQKTEQYESMPGLLLNLLFVVGKV